MDYQTIAEFQSAPGPGAGRYRRVGVSIARLKGFNPLPARGPGDTRL